MENNFFIGLFSSTQRSHADFQAPYVGRNSAQQWAEIRTHFQAPYVGRNDSGKKSNIQQIFQAPYVGRNLNLSL